MKKKIVFYSLVILSTILWLFPISCHKTDVSLQPIVTSVANAGLTEGEQLDVQNGKTVIKQAFIDLGLAPMVKRLPAGTRLSLLSRKENFIFKVKLEAGEIGYLNMVDIVELRKMEAKKKVTFYTDERLSKKGGILEPGTKVNLTDIINDFGTLALKTEDGKTIFVWAKEAMGWNESLGIEDLPKDDQSNASDLTITEDYLKNRIMGKDFNSLEKELRQPDSYITFAGDSARATFKHIWVFNGDHIRKPLKVTFKGGLAEKYSVGYSDKSPFFVSLPLTGLFAKMGWPAIISSNFSDVRPTWLNQLLDSDGLYYILGLLAKFIMLILFLSVPYILTYVCFYYCARVKTITNQILRIIIFPLLFLLYYLYFLILFIHFGSHSPLFYFVACLVLAGLYTWWLNSKISYHRCPKCFTMNSALDKGSDLLSMTSRENLVTNTVYTGTTTTTHTITHHYEKRSHIETKSTAHYADHRKCKECGHNWDVHRTE